MNRRSDRAFVNQMLACALVLGGTTGAAGLGAVWMRYQVSLAATANKTIENRITTISRRLADVNTEVELASNTDALLRRNEEFRLGLAPVKEAQTQTIHADTAMLLALKRNRALLGADAPAPAWDLALGGAR